MKTKIQLSVILTVISCVFISAQPPTGYYDSAFGKKKDALKTAMKEIIRPHTARSYDQLWTDFQQTDKRPDNGKVWDMYSDIPDGTPRYYYTFKSDQCGNYGGEGDCYNREHSFPKSWFNDASPMYTDLFHLYPTDGYVNGRRSNDPFGEVGSAKWTSTNGSKSGSGTSASGYTGTVFEPINAYKGDFARTYFYMVTCYEDNVTSWNSDMLNKTKYPAFSTWALNLLLKWSRNDEVSQKETDRNNAVYKIQGNRNPYIDYPQLAEYVWGDSVTYAFNPNAGPSSITQPDDDTDYSVLYVESGILHVINSFEGATIQIYDVAGRLLLQETKIPELYSVSLPEDRFFIVRITNKSGQLRAYKITNIGSN